MIYLTKGQKLFTNEGMVVYDATGHYDDGDAVVCAAAYAPDEPICRYEAKFIAYGDNVYNITDPEKLMEEVKKIDPENLFGKNKEEVAVDKMIEKIKKPVNDEEIAPETDEVEEEGEVLGEESEPEVVDETAPEETVTEPTPEPEPTPEFVPEPEVIPAPEEPATEVIPTEETVPPVVEPEPTPEVTPEPEVAPVSEEPISLLTRKRKRKVA